MQGVKIEEATSWLEKISGKIEVENLYPSWLVFGEGFRRSTAFIAVRRALSVVISLIGLILALPLFPLIMLAIRLDSKGPVFYTQTRVGKDGRVFKVVKFRTMRQDAEAANGPQWAGNGDPRVTRVGKFLRSSRLDEIPQLWCVLKGDMAFVGPRPERPEFIELLSKDIPYYGCATWCGPASPVGRRSSTSTAARSKIRAKNSSTTCSTSRTLRLVWIC